MFERIKLKIIKGRQLNAFATAQVLQDHEDRLKKLEGDDGEDSPIIVETFDLSFVVDDGTDAVEGATVTIGEVTGTTGKAGGCTLKNIPVGTQSVTVEATGFTTKTESITVDENHTTFTVSLVATG